MSVTAYILTVPALWVWCVLYFWLFQKPAFGFWNSRTSPRPPTLKMALRTYRKGAVSDFIIASYFVALPIFICLVAVIVPRFNPRRVLIGYTALFAVAVALTSIGDIGLYRFWKAKIDASVFAYLRHPAGAFASVSGAYMAVALTCVVIAALFFFAGGAIIILFLTDAPRPATPTAGTIAAASLICLLMAATAALIIRGVRKRGNNPSMIYFSGVPFYNHWALNPVYNLIHSLTTGNDFKGRFITFDEKTRSELFTPLFPTEGKPAEKVLKTDRPDILIIVWESFSARFSEAGGGNPEITPNFNRYCREGLLFTHCRASSFRTDRALPAIFCGVPGQPTTTLIRYTRKLSHLPSFPADLRGQGYRTLAIHAGDMTRMHKNDFYFAAGHSDIVAQKDMPRDWPKCDWGIHDGPVAGRVFEEMEKMNAQGSPWLVSWQTLSSHMPYKVPYARLADEEENSMAYTDRAIGSLLDRLKSSPMWDNLLVVILADHGIDTSRPDVTRERNSMIPMLWTGGAVRRTGTVDCIMSQSDLPATLLGQLGLPHRSYPFSRDVMAPSYRIPSSFHTYIDGMMFTDATGFTDYNTLTGTAVDGTADTAREQRGLAVLQTLYQYLDRL